MTTDALLALDPVIPVVVLDDAAHAVPLARALRPNWAFANAGIAFVFVFVAVALYSDRDLAPVFGHLSPIAGQPHR